MNRYLFRAAVGAYFHVDTKAVRAWLPPSLVPLEARPGHAVLAVTSFDFVDSEAGPYGEVVLSILVPPFASRGVELPHAATFPIVLLTTTDASAAHNAERWFLPGFGRSVEINLSQNDDRRILRVYDQGKPLLTLTVQRNGGAPATRLFQVFTTNEGALHRANVRFIGDLDEHQNETGRLELFSHPLADRIAQVLLDDLPIVEQSMNAGEEQYADVVRHLSEST